MPREYSRSTFALNPSPGKPVTLTGFVNGISSIEITRTFDFLRKVSVLSDPEANVYSLDLLRSGGGKEKFKSLVSEGI